MEKTPLRCLKDFTLEVMKDINMRKIFKSIIIIVSLVVLIAALFGKVFSRQDRPAGLIYAVGGIEVDFTSDNWPFFETNFLPGDSVSKIVKVTNNSGRFQRVRFRLDNEEGFLLSLPLFIKIKDKNTGQIYYGGVSGKPLFLSYVLPTGIKLFSLPPDPPNNEKELEVEIRFIPEAGNLFQNRETKFDFTLVFIGKRIRRRFPFFFFSRR